MASRSTKSAADPPPLMTAPAPAAPKRLFIKTYGCQMNVYDSERMADLLRPLGYAVADVAEGADLVVLNTCHIREKATEKVYSELGDRKSTRLNSSHANISYAVFCLKKKTNTNTYTP